MKRFLLFLGMASLLQLNANESFNSEISHVAGGIVMAGAVTAVVEAYYPEYRNHRGMIGFGLSTVAMAGYEAWSYTKTGAGKGQILDVAVHTLGSAIGAYVTDQYLLTPIIKNSPTEGQYAGVLWQYSF